VVTQALSQETLLPKLKLLTLSIERRFDQRGRRKVLLFLDLIEDDLAAIATASHLTDHSLRKGLSGVPEKLEFVLYPGDAFWRFVLPQDLVMTLPATASLVHRANKAELAAIRERNHARFAMHETADLVRCHSYGLPVLLQKGM